jgi:hypothetical protein
MVVDKEPSAAFTAGPAAQKRGDVGSPRSAMGKSVGDRPSSSCVLEGISQAEREGPNIGLLEYREVLTR